MHDDSSAKNEQPSVLEDMVVPHSSKRIYTLILQKGIENCHSMSVLHDFISQEHSYVFHVFSPCFPYKDLRTFLWSINIFLSFCHLL